MLIWHDQIIKLDPICTVPDVS